MKNFASHSRSCQQLVIVVVDALDDDEMLGRPCRLIHFPALLGGDDAVVCRGDDEQWTIDPTDAVDRRVPIT
jgi:hypothetical protein